MHIFNAFLPFSKELWKLTAVRITKSRISFLTTEARYQLHGI